MRIIDTDIWEVEMHDALNPTESNSFIMQRQSKNSSVFRAQATLHGKLFNITGFETRDETGEPCIALEMEEA